MDRTIKTILILLMLLAASSQIAFSKDPIKINTGTLEINDITAKGGKSAVVFNGLGDPVKLAGQGSGALLKEHLGVKDGYTPIRGFAYVEGEIYGLARTELVMSKKGYFFIRVTCTVNNISDSAQSFSIGDIRLKDVDTQIKFLAAGPRNLAYRVHNSEDYKKLAEIVYNLEPNTSERFSYIFVTEKAKKPWKLSYKEGASVGLEIK